MGQDALPFFALGEFMANIPCRLRRIGRKEINKQPLASENGIEGVCPAAEKMKMGEKKKIRERVLL